MLTIDQYTDWTHFSEVAYFAVLKTEQTDIWHCPLCVDVNLCQHVSIKKLSTAENIRLF